MTSPSLQKVLADPRYMLAYGLGSGLVPRAPGTAGSLLALLVFVPLLAAPLVVQVVIIVLAFAIGVPVTDRVAREMDLKDPSGIVWDEFVGMWLTMLWLPSLWWLPAAFGFFRFFDIVKPWPASLADREISGGLGIMLDDVVAGIYALASVQLCSLALTWLTSG